MACTSSARHYLHLAYWLWLEQALSWGVTDASMPCHLARSKPPTMSGSQRARPERLRLPLWLRSKRLVDLPEVAFWIGKVRRAQPPGLVGWGSEKRDSLDLERLVCGIDILNTSGQKPPRPSLDL